MYTVEKDPSDKLSLAALDMSAVKGVKLDYALPTTSAKTVKDFDYAEDENRIYLSVGTGVFSLNGIITWMEAPFNEGDNWTVYRATSFFSSSGRDANTGRPTGGGRFTDAPIETISYENINGTGFLSGLNTCSPGFSSETSTIRAQTSTFIAGIGADNTLAFIQTFNLLSNSPSFIFHHSDSTATYLFTMGGGGVPPD